MSKKKCSYADKYKATRPPKCNGGQVCDACWEKWTRAKNIASDRTMGIRARRLHGRLLGLLND